MRSTSSCFPFQAARAPMANAINRGPLKVKALDVPMAAHPITPEDKTGEVPLLLNGLLHCEGHAASVIDVRPFGDNAVEIGATLAARAANTEYLERLVAKMSAAPCVGNTYSSPVMLEPPHQESRATPLTRLQSGNIAYIFA